MPVPRDAGPIHQPGGSPDPASTADHSADHHADQYSVEHSDHERGHGDPFYLVQPHDDLWELAGRLYGDPTSWRRLAAANRLDAASVLYPGQVLRVPGLSAQEITARTGQPAPDSTPRTIVVRPGDTLTGLAQRHLGTEAAWPALQAANPTLVVHPGHIEPGWVLHLPPRPFRLADASPHTTTPPHTTARAHRPTATPPASPSASPSAPAPSARSGQGHPGQESAPSGVPTALGSVAAPAGSPSAAPSTPAPTRTPASLGAAAPRAAQPPTAGDQEADDSGLDHALLVAALAGLTAATGAGVLAAVRRRRREQDFDRPLGRRHPRPGREGAALDATLRRLGALDPESPRGQSRTGATSPGATTHGAANPGAATPGAATHGTALGATAVVVGESRAASVADRVTLDLADAGQLFVTGPRGLCRAAGAALVVSLSTAPWSDGVPAHVVSERLGWLAELGNPLVDVSGDPVSGMARLRRRLTGSIQPPDAEGESPDDEQPPQADEVWVLDLLGLDADEQLDQVQATTTLLRQSGAAIRPVWLTGIPASRLRVLLDTLAEISTGRGDGGDLLELRSDQHAELSGVPDPFVPNLVTEPARRALVDLMGSATTTQIEPAPWWAPEATAPETRAPETAAPSGAHPATMAGSGTDAARPAHPSQPVQTPTVQAAPVQTVPSQTPSAPRAFDAAWNEEPLPASATPTSAVVTALPDTGRRRGVRPTGRLPLSRRPDTEHVEATVARLPEILANPAHPTLLMLGPVELRGAHGQPPNRAMKQCLEYCGWILAHPRQTSVAMAGSLLVAEATRRSNMSRLRTWLGATPDGEDYLPDAYSGRIQLHPLVTSDWEHLQLLTSAGVNRASDDALVEALELVRGAPMADAAPGQWHWAEEERTQMQQAVRDIGVLLAQRALAEGDVDLARWGAARALVACPEDELLLATRVRTEHLAGNRPEVERLVLHLTRSARALGVDLSDDTVVLLQQVMEGRVRARA